MRYGLFITAVVALTTMVGEPALARQARATRPPEAMQLGPVAPAPLGYVEFCQRQPADCPGTPADSASFGGSYWSLTFQQAERSRFAGQKPASMRGFFRGFRRTSRQAVPSAAVIQPAAGDKAIALNRRAWEDLERVNTGVNNAIIATPDLYQYAAEDHWALPQAGRRGRLRGDCEDYVLEKRHQLLQLGYPQDALSIALVHTRWNEHHAVLIVETTAGAYVLDSLSSRIQPWSAIDYHWVVRQSPKDASQWVEILSSDHAAPQV